MEKGGGEKMTFERFISICEQEAKKMNPEEKLRLLAKLTENPNIQKKINKDKEREKRWDDFLRSLFPEPSSMIHEQQKEDLQTLASVKDILNDIQPTISIAEDIIRDLKKRIFNEIEESLTKTAPASTEDGATKRINESLREGLANTARDISDLSYTPEIWNATQDALDRATEMLCAERLPERQDAFQIARRAVTEFISLPKAHRLISSIVPLIDSVRAQRTLRTLITPENRQNPQSLFLAFFSRIWWQPSLFKEDETHQNHYEKTMNFLLTESILLALTNPRDREARENLEQLKDLWEETLPPKKYKKIKNLIPFSKKRIS